MSSPQMIADVRSDVLRKATEQLSAAHMLGQEVNAWIKACTRGKTAVSTSGAMAHLLERSIASYSYLNARARLWAIGHGCLPSASHAEMWTATRVAQFAAHHRRQDGEQAKPSYTRIMLVAIERMMRVTAPHVDTRFILDEINALPRETNVEVKRRRLRDSEALWDCGLLLLDKPLRFTPFHGNPEATQRTGVQIAALSEWALRLQEFTHIELWLDQVPPDNYPHACLTRRFGRLYLEFLHNSDSDKSLPPSQPVSERLSRVLENYIAGLREQQRGGYDGRRLWVSSRQGPLNGNGLYKQMVARTEDVFGVAVGPHLFRDAQATSESQCAPDKASVSHLRLGHSPRINRKVYDHSGTREAGLLMSVNADAMITAQMDQWSSCPSQQGSLRATVMSRRRSR